MHNSGDRSPAQAAYVLRKAAFDELGLDFDNDAIVGVSEPVLSLQAPQKMAVHSDRPFSMVYVQIIVVDAKKVQRLHRSLGRDRPTTEGDWGHFAIGGQPLRCRENERYGYGTETCYVFDDIRTLDERNEPHNRNLPRVDPKWTKWRPCRGSRGGAPTQYIRILGGGRSWRACSPLQSAAARSTWHL